MDVPYVNDIMPTECCFMNVHFFENITLCRPKCAIAQIEMVHWATYIKLLWLELIYFREEDVRFESRRITIQFVQKFTTGLPLELLLPKINVITSSSTSSKIRDLTLTL